MSEFLQRVIGYQGDRKGAPLLYTRNEYNMHRSIVGAHPCGRPGERE
jgi:hypothetical protein